MLTNRPKTGIKLTDEEKKEAKAKKQKTGERRRNNPQMKFEPTPEQAVAAAVATIAVTAEK
jgi:hypothetical protein